MALPACFHLADEVFPAVRQAAAKALVAAGWTQSRTARHLGVSQAMISKYLNRGTSDDPLVARLAADLVADAQGDAEPRSWCGLLGQADVDEALRDLLTAEGQLMAANPTRLVPEIGLNIARLRSDGETLSYPGRLVKARDRILRPAAPAVDDGHLPRCLKRANQTDADTRAIASIAGSDAVRRAAQDAGIKLATAADACDHDQRFLGAWRPGTAVHDPGAVGVEACIYLTGPDAATLVDQMLRIAARLSPIPLPTREVP